MLTNLCPSPPTPTPSASPGLSTLPANLFFFLKRLFVHGSDPVAVRAVFFSVVILRGINVDDFNNFTSGFKAAVASLDCESLTATCVRHLACRKQAVPLLRRPKHDLVTRPLFTRPHPIP